MIVAIVPAAGESRRMGQAKLLLPIAGSTLIARVVSALRTGGADRVVVVTPPSDAPESAALQREATVAGAEVVVPTLRPPDMRGSVERGLTHLDCGDSNPTTILLVPADSPGLSGELVAKVIAQASAAPVAIVIPVVGARRGHPIALPWMVASGIKALPAGVGVNALVKANEGLIVTIDVADASVLADLDTPEDYSTWADADGS